MLDNWIDKEWSSLVLVWLLFCLFAGTIIKLFVFSLSLSLSRCVSFFISLTLSLSRSKTSFFLSLKPQFVHGGFRQRWRRQWHHRGNHKSKASRRSAPYWSNKFLIHLLPLISLRFGTKFNNIPIFLTSTITSSSSSPVLRYLILHFLFPNFA